MRCILVVLLLAAPVYAQNPLPSWNDTAPKKAIVAFVEKVTKEGSPDFVPVPERIATFDNDGTLWCEQPIYFQFVFAIDRVKALAPQHPEWKKQQPFAAVLSGDKEALLASGQKGLMQIMAVSHSGMSDRGICQNRRSMVRDCPASAFQPPLHGFGLSTDAGTSGLSAR